MMKNKTPKERTFKEEVKLYLRGMKILWEVDRKLLLFSLFDVLLSILMSYVLLYTSSLVLNGLYAAEDFMTLMIKALICISVSLLMNLLSHLFRNLTNRAQSNLFNRLYWYMVHNRMFKMYEYSENPEITRLYDRATRSLVDMGYEYKSLIECAVKLVTSMSVSLGIFFFTADVPTGSLLAKVVNSPLVLPVIVLIIGVGIAINFKIGKITNDRVYAHERSYDDVYSLLNYYCSIMENSSDLGMDIRIFGLASVISAEQYKNNIRAAFYKEQMQIERPQIVMTQILEFVTQVTLYSYVALRAFYGAIAIGDFVFYAGALVNFSAAIRGIADMVNDIYMTNKNLADTFRYIDLPNTMYEGTLPVEKRILCQQGDNDYQIEFRNVSFKYPNTDVYVLKNINIKFKIGKKLAVVGQNGSGKTTFIKLLCRLYDPTEGEILLNGVDIRKYDYEEYHSIFSVVFQDFKLFSFSLAENVAASTQPDRQLVMECCKKAGLPLSDQPTEGHLTPETILYKDYEKEGVEISGGEAQKIALARALYKNAPFIVLDEPTAALDPIAEAEVYRTFNDIVGERTAIYISHRLSSCRFCDEIMVFDNGTVVQHGTHNILIAENGMYRELWYAQAQYYEN